MYPEIVSPEDGQEYQLLYFTSSSIAKGDDTLFCIGDGDGNPNLYVVDLRKPPKKRTARQLTRNQEGTLLSYVYFRGQYGRGFGKASVSLDPIRRIAYFVQGWELKAVDAAGQIRRITRIPEGQVSAFTHVSHDGKYICVPTTDARALESESVVSGTPDINKDQYVDQRPSHNVDKRIREEGLSSYLRVYDTATGEAVLEKRFPDGWITHEQFHPSRNDTILFNNEWAESCGVRRIWLWENGEWRKVRTAAAGRKEEDWVCHEVWSPDGASILYHGKYEGGPYFIGKQDSGGSTVEIAFPENYISYGHFYPSPLERDTLVSDGYYRENEDPLEGHGRWLSLCRLDWVRGTTRWSPLCRHGSNWDSQDSHPHPIFSHDGSQVYFTSNKETRRGVYRIGVRPPKAEADQETGL